MFYLVTSSSWTDFDDSFLYLKGGAFEIVSLVFDRDLAST